MDLLISPSKLHGTVQVPASKSMMHRALICAALADGISVIRNAYISQDITATMDCLRTLGADFQIEGSVITVTGIKDSPKQAVFDCAESGSTIRFLIPIAAALCDYAEFHGHGKLVTRPLDLYRDAFANKGVQFDYTGTLPASLEGSLQSGTYQIRGDVSSQFITGLLFTLPLLEGDSVIEVLPPFESKSYVDITLACLQAFGVSVKQDGLTYHVFGGQHYRSADYTVESDYSQAVFFLAANVLGSSLALQSFAGTSVQGDSAVIRILEETGAVCQFENQTLQTTFPNKKAFRVDASDIPDLVPALCVLACFCEGETIITHVERLKIKESDRIASTMELINRMGGQIRYEQDTLFVAGGQTAFDGAEINCYNDHRIAMAAAIAATAADSDVLLHGAECVNKSFPTFFEVFEELGGVCHVIHVDERN